MTPKNMPEIEAWHLKEFKKQYLPLLDTRGKGLGSNDRSFINYLKKHIDEIIIGKPDTLDSLINEVEDEFSPKFYFFKNSSKNKKKIKTANALFNKIFNIFNYKNFSGNANDGWNAYTLMSKLGVDSCPFCNRAYTHTIYDPSKSKEEDRRIVRPDLDHFIDKASYPFLALSLYNLIPSCLVCNSRHKGTKEFRAKTHIHPYQEGFDDDAKFQLRINNSSFFGGNLDASEIRLVVNTNDQQKASRIKNNIDVLKLEYHYQEHKDYVYELMMRSYAYPEDYIKSLYDQYGGSLFHKREDVLRLVHGNYIGEDQLGRRPLSKLTNDILDQFEL